MLQNKNRFMLRIIAAFMGAFMFQLTLSQAASIYDPKHSWRTIESPRFDVHYPDETGYRNLAVRISRIAESSLDDVAKLTGFMPDGRIDIVVSDFSDEVNGSATVMPRNTLRLYVDRAHREYRTFILR